MKLLRILIADDHEIVREGLRALLQARPNWQICGEVTNGREAVEKVKQLRPDVVVLDFSMPELNGLEATRQIRKTYPEAHVLILTMHESETLAQEVVAAGARGFVVKTDAKLHLIAAIEAISRNQLFITPRFSASLLTNFLHPKARLGRTGTISGQLTSRELEVLQLIAEGKSSKEVATALDISLKTVDAHRTNVMRKLDLHSVSDLVRYAIRNKIIQP